MSNKKIKVRTCILLCIICIFCTATVFGSSTMKQIVAYLNYGLNIMVDGEVQELYDASGNRVYPISYSGTTYVPIRGLGDILNVGVDWNSKTGNVEIKTKKEIEKRDLLIGLNKKADFSYIIEKEEDKNIVLNDTSVITFDNGIYCKTLQNQDFKLTDYIGISLLDTIKTVTFDAFSENNTSLNIFNQQGKLLKTVYLKPNIVNSYILNIVDQTNELFFVGISQNDTENNGYIKIFNIFGE